MRTRPFPSRRNRLVVEMPAGEGLDINCTRLLCHPSSDEPEPPNVLCTENQPVWDAVNCVRFGFVAGGEEPVGFCPTCDPSYGTAVGDLPDGFGLGGDNFSIVNGDGAVEFTASFNPELAGGDIGAYGSGTATLYDAQCNPLTVDSLSIMQGDGDSAYAYFGGVQLVEGQTYYVEFCPTEPGE